MTAYRISYLPWSKETSTTKPGWEYNTTSFNFFFIPLNPINTNSANSKFPRRIQIKQRHLISSNNNRIFPAQIYIFNIFYEETLCFTLSYHDKSTCCLSTVLSQLKDLIYILTKQCPDIWRCATQRLTPSRLS